MVVYSIEQRVFMVRTYWATNSFKRCQSEFRKKYHVHDVPSKSVIQKMVRKLETTGSLIPSHGGGRPKLSQDTIDDMQLRLRQSPTKSLRRIAQETGRSYSTCQRAAKRAKLHAYGVTVVEGSKASDLENVIRQVKLPNESEEHSHTHEHGHTHDLMTSPGDYLLRDMPLYRTDFDKRAFTVGIGGPVGSGKTALVLALCKVMRERYQLCIVTNDIFTREDWEFLVKHEALPAERIKAVETGGCPHAAIREDYSLNLEMVKDLTKKFKPNILLLESGGDNLAANFSRDLADYIIYVIDVAGGDKIPRKGGPGITESDLLVINKVDLAEAVGASIQVMERDSALMRQGGPCVLTEATHMVGVEDVVKHILTSYRELVDKSLTPPFI